MKNAKRHPSMLRVVCILSLAPVAGIDAQTNTLHRNASETQAVTEMRGRLSSALARGNVAACRQEGENLARYSQAGAGKALIEADLAAIRQRLQQISRVYDYFRRIHDLNEAKAVEEAYALIRDVQNKLVNDVLVNVTTTLVTAPMAGVGPVVVAMGAGAEDFLGSYADARGLVNRANALRSLEKMARYADEQMGSLIPAAREAEALRTMLIDCANQYQEGAALVPPNRPTPPATAPSPDLTSPATTGSGHLGGGSWQLRDARDSSYVSMSDIRLPGVRAQPSVTFSDSSIKSQASGTYTDASNQEVQTVRFVHQQVTSWTDFPLSIMPGVTYSSTLKMIWTPMDAIVGGGALMAPSGDRASVSTGAPEVTLKWKLDAPSEFNLLNGQAAVYAEVHGEGPGGNGSRTYQYDWVARNQTAADPAADALARRRELLARRETAARLRKEGEALQSQGLLNEAVAKYRESLTYLPDPAMETYIGQVEAVALQREQSAQAAAQQEADQQRAGLATGERLRTEGIDLQKQGELRGAAAKYRESLRHRPDPELETLIPQLEAAAAGRERAAQQQSADQQARLATGLRLRTEGIELQKKGKLRNAAAKYRESLRHRADPELATIIGQLEAEADAKDKQKGAAWEAALGAIAGVIDDEIARERAAAEARPKPTPPGPGPATPPSAPPPPSPPAPRTEAPECSLSGEWKLAEAGADGSINSFFLRQTGTSVAGTYREKGSSGALSWDTTSPTSGSMSGRDFRITVQIQGLQAGETKDMVFVGSVSADCQTFNGSRTFLGKTIVVSFRHQ